MANLNKVFLMGRLTADPELRYTQTGTAVADIRLAINRSYKTQAGESREDTCYVDVVLWARQAEIVKKHMTKGRPIFIEGRLKLDSWEGKDGEKRSRLRVVAENFQFLSGPGRDDGERSGTDRPTGDRPGTERYSGERNRAMEPASNAPPADDYQDDLGFPEENMPF